VTQNRFSDLIFSLFYNEIFSFSVNHEFSKNYDMKSIAIKFFYGIFLFGIGLSIFRVVTEVNKGAVNYFNSTFYISSTFVFILSAVYLLMEFKVRKKEFSLWILLITCLSFALRTFMYGVD
tara:strand:- start:391 stop:753 length:363 start_codon:yes stop_codon:yes gene_type:complete